MKTYTIEELQAMPDADLNKLAAELRGWRVAFGAVDTPAGETVREHHWEGEDENGELGAIISLLDWQPASDRNQSGKLLMWAMKKHGLTFLIPFDLTDDEIEVTVWETRSPIKPRVVLTISGNDARAETESFCAAMQAIQNAQGGASE